MKSFRVVLAVMALFEAFALIKAQGQINSPPGSAAINDTNTAAVLAAPRFSPAITPQDVRPALSPPASSSNGLPGTAIAPQASQPAIGQQGFGTTIAPQSNEPAIGQPGFGTAIAPPRNEPQIGQPGFGTALGQPTPSLPPPSISSPGAPLKAPNLTNPPLDTMGPRTGVAPAIPGPTRVTPAPAPHR